MLRCHRTCSNSRPPYATHSADTPGPPPHTHTPVQVLEVLPLHAVTWLPCALPGKDHCLSLRVAAGRPRELVLRAPSRDRALELAAQLDAASQQLAQRSLREAILQAQLAPGAGAVQQGEEEGAVAGGIGASESQAGQAGSEEGRGRQQHGGRSLLVHSDCPTGRPLPGVDEDSCCSSSAASSARSSEGEEVQQQGSQQRDFLSSRPAASPCPTASAPAAAAPAAEAAAGSPAAVLPVVPVAGPLPPVRLLSFSSRKGQEGQEGQGGGGRVASHVEQLERMVSQLSREVATSRGNTPKVRLC